MQKERERWEKEEKDREREKKVKGIEINLLLWEMKNHMDVNRAGGFMRVEYADYL